MILSFHPCFDAHVHIILGDRRLASDDLKLIQCADAIILPQVCPEGLHEACIKSSALIFPSYEIRSRYPGKIGQSLLFSQFNFKHPKTIPWKAVKEFKEACPDLPVFPHKIPFLIKADKIHEANGIFLVKDKSSLSGALDYLTLQERTGLSGFVTQDYIPCGGNALRAVIIGKRIITYWKRSDKPGQVITTISRGGIIDHQWQPALQEKGRLQAQALSRKTGINLAAVDFVLPLTEKAPEPLFLEINYSFGRRGLGGSIKYYRLLYKAIQDWLKEVGLDHESVRLV